MIFILADNHAEYRDLRAKVLENFFRFDRSNSKVDDIKFLDRPEFVLGMNNFTVIESANYFRRDLPGKTYAERRRVQAMILSRHGVWWLKGWDFGRFQ